MAIDSANTMPRIMLVRNSPPPSGFRPMPNNAPLTIRPMPMPGPMAPAPMAMPAPRSLAASGSMRCVLLCEKRMVCRGPCHVLAGRLVMLAPVQRGDGQGHERQDKHGEHVGLDQADEQLQ